MRREDVGDVVVVAQLGARHAPAAAALGPELVGRDGLDVAPLAHRDDELLVVDQVLDVDVADVVGDLGAALVRELLADVGKLLLDHREHPALVGQDGLQVGDVLAQLLQLGLEVDPGQPGELPEPHVEDVLGLVERELEGLDHQAGAGRGTVLRGPDEGDDLVDDVDRLEEALDQVGARLLLVQAELASPPDDLDLVIDVRPQHLHEVEGARHAVDQRHRVHGEVGLQRRVLVQVVEDDERRRVLLQLDDEPGVAARRLVVDVGDALDLAGLDQVLDLDRGGRDRRLVGHLGDDDAIALAAGALDDLGTRPAPGSSPGRCGRRR